MSHEHDAPEEGRPRCGRKCADGSPCERRVPMAGVACYTHQP